MLTVIVAIYNTNLLLFKRMLDSLLRHAPDMTQLVIIDNASEDKSYIDVLLNVLNIVKGTESKPIVYTPGKRRYDCYAFEGSGINSNIKLHIMTGVNNYGFGCACNDAIAFLHTRGQTTEYVAIVNDDVEWFEEWSKEMIKELEDPKVKQMGMSTSACNKLSYLGQAYGEWTKEPDYCEGSCFMMRFKDALRYGPFDDIYQFAYCEDSDLSLRIRKDGYRIKAIFVNWIHHRAVTSGKTKVDINGYRELNKKVFHKRWNSFLLKGRYGRYIIIRRTGSIGDVFLTTPIALALKQQYPGCVIALATACPQLVEKSPVIDVIINDMHTPFICDHFIDLDNVYERDFRKSILDIYAAAAGVGKLPQRTGVLGAAQENIRNIDKLLSESQRAFVVLDLSDTWLAKQWPYEGYVELAKKINKDGQLGIILMGNVADYNRKEYIKCDMDLVNQLPSLLDTAILLSKAALYIGHEGAVAHIAQALQGLPHIILYGCSTPELVSDTSLSTWHGAVTKAVCRGCSHVYAAGNMVLCSREYECMRMITAEEVFDKYMEVIGKIKCKLKNLK